MLSWLSLRCGGAGWSATIQLGRTMAHATCFRGGQRRGKRGSGVWRCGNRVGSVRMACFTHLIPLHWRLEPGHGTASSAPRAGGRERLPGTQKAATAAAADEQSFWFPRVCLATSRVIACS